MSLYDFVRSFGSILDCIATPWRVALVQQARKAEVHPDSSCHQLPKRVYIPLNAPTGASKADAVACSAHVPSLVTQGVPVLCFVFLGGVQLKSDLVKEKPELSGTMHHGSQPQIQRLRDVFIKSLKNCIRVSSC